MGSVTTKFPITCSSCFKKFYSIKAYSNHCMKPEHKKNQRLRFIEMELATAINTIQKIRMNIVD